MDKQLFHCVQCVGNYWYNYVYRLCTNVPRFARHDDVLYSSGDNLALSTSCTRLYTPLASTGKRRKFLEVARWLSTVSTVPITTTTIYIIRKERI